MPNIITAGNSTNGGTAISTDTSGTLNIVTGSGSGANAITIDASQNVTMAANQTVSGNVTVSGTLTASGGVSGSITSGTAVASTSGTSITFTGIPSTAKRITVMFNGVSTNGTSNLLLQIGSGSITSTGYASGAYSSNTVNSSSTAGFLITGDLATADVHAGHLIITVLSGFLYVQSGVLGQSVSSSVNGAVSVSGGTVTLSGALDRVRVTTVNGTDTFDAGSINILYE